MIAPAFSHVDNRIGSSDREHRALGTCYRDAESSDGIDERLQFEGDVEGEVVATGLSTW